MLTRSGALLTVALFTLSPLWAAARTNVASSTATSSAPTITALQSLVTQFEAEFTALAAAKGTLTKSASEAAPTTHITFTRVLSLGSTGTDVFALQQILKNA
ncbi:MAG: hypothetical protein P4L81_03830, partial [Candidatus Pacebacteria bacterium]|nr:hypothetical protein [Candidatus Paceibacterota bacterium]